MCLISLPAGSIRPVSRQIQLLAVAMRTAAYGFIMFAQCSVYDAAIEQDLGCVGDIIESFQGLFEFVVVVMPEGGNPSLNFLPGRLVSESALL